MSPRRPAVLSLLGLCSLTAAQSNTTPGLEPSAARAIGDLGDGLPGRIVPLALAARRWRGGEAPLPTVEAFRAHDTLPERVMLS